MRGQSGRRFWLVVVVVAMVTAGVSMLGAAVAKTGSKPSQAKEQGSYGVASSGGGATGGAAVDRRIARSRARRAADRRARAKAPARAQRRRSRTAHAGLSDAAAVRIARRAHRDVITDPLWVPIRLRGRERVVRYLGSHSARIDRGPGKPDGLVRSTLPLRAGDAGGDPAPVDVRLRRTDRGFQPVNPLVSMRAGKRLGAGVAFADNGVVVRPIGAADADGRLVGGRAFYANALPDTDWIVRPLPEGIQTFAQLRSAASPEQLALRFDLPEGATIRRETEGPGGWAVVKGDRVLGRFGPPRAWDADGAPVGVTTDLEGNVLRMTAEHRGADVRYPVMVDPPYVEDSYSWKDNTVAGTGQGQNGDYAGWVPAVSDAAKYKMFKGSSYLGHGLYAYTRTSLPYTTADFGEWRFSARGYGDAFVYKTAFAKLYHDGYNTATTLYTGIYTAAKVVDGTAPQTQSAGRYDYWTNTHCVVAVTCSYTGTKGNMAIFGTRPDTNAQRSNFTDFMGAATVYQADNAIPTLTKEAFPATWIKSAPGMVGTMSDTGLGMKSLTVKHDGGRAWTHSVGLPASSSKSVSDGCAGTHTSACPKDLSVTFDAGDLPDGPHQLTFTGTDILGTPGTATRTLKLDNNGPGIAFSGGLSQPGMRPSGDTLRITATDGASTPASEQRSGARDIDVLLKKETDTAFTAQPDVPEQDCPGGSCPMTRDFKLDGNGRYVIRAIARDQVGNTSEKDITVSIDGGKPTLKVEGGLRTFPVATGREFTATATDSDGGVRDIEVFRKPTTALTPDTAAPLSTERVQLEACSTGCTSATGFPSRYRLPDNTPTGRYQFTVRTTDTVGNVAEDRWVAAVVQMRTGRRAKLGLEQWFELDDSDAGGEQSLYVNGETGNVVWHAVPVVNPSRGLSSALNVTYNSQDRSGLLGIDLGRIPLVGVNPDDDEVLGNDLTGLAYREAGMNVSLAIGGPTRVNEPLGGVLAAGTQERLLAAHNSAWQTDDSRISMTDADGTQHVFTRSRTDTAWRSPAGVNMRLRYTGPRGVDAALRFTQTQLESDAAWELLRPDGIRFIFDSFGYLQKTVDRNGNQMNYVYKFVSSLNGADCAQSALIGRLQAGVGLCIPQLQEVRQPTWAADNPATTEVEPASKRKIALAYTAPSGTIVDLSKTLGLPADTLIGATHASGGSPQVDTITDAAGRKLKFDYYTTGDLKGYLREIRENDGATNTVATGDVKRVTRLKYDEPFATNETKPRTGDLQQLTAVVPVVDGVEKAATTIGYEARANPIDPVRPPAPRRAVKLTKRGGAPKLFRYGTGTFEVLERTTGTRHLRRQVTLDANQRPAKVVESSADLSSETATPAPVTAQGQTTTELVWNDQENKPSEVREAVGTPQARTVTSTYVPKPATENATPGALTSQTVKVGTDLRQTTYEYHPNREAGFITDLSKIIKPGNRAFSYTDDGLGNVRFATNPNMVTTETRYDPAQNNVLLSEQDEMGRWTTYAEHDLSGQPQKVTRPSAAGKPARTWTYRYNELGDVIKVIDPRGTPGAEGPDNAYVTTLGYDPFSRLNKERTPRDSGPDHTAADGDRFVERTREFDRDGNTTKIIDAQKRTTSVAFDAMGKPSSVSEPASDGTTEVTRYVHDDAQRLILQVSARGGVVDEAAVRNGHVAACEQDGDQGSFAFATRHCLDHRDLPLATTRYSQRTGDIARLTTSFAYDGRGNVVGQSDPNRNTTLDPAGVQQPLTIRQAILRAADPAQRRASYDYDLEDRRTLETEKPLEAGEPARVRKLDYDPAGDLITVTDDHPTEADRITRMDYDQMGRMLATRDPLGRMTCLKRDKAGEIVARTSPRGTVGSTVDTCKDANHRYGAHTAEFVYDGAGELQKRTIPYLANQYGAHRADVKTWSVTYDRDQLGNPTTVTDARGTQVTNKFYDGGQLRSTTRPSFWELDWGGQAGQGASNPGHGDRYGVDDAADTEVAEDGPTLSEADGDTKPGKTEQLATPDSLGKGDLGDVQTSPLPEWLPQAGATTLRYDPEMRLAEVEDADGTSRRIYYDPAGRVKQKRWPIDARNAVHDFGYDLNGNLTSVTEDWRTKSDGTDDRVSTTYGYDGYDRRIEEDTEGANPDAYANAAIREKTKFAYDANDNVTARTTPRNTKFTYTYNTLDELATEANPTGQTYTYRYNAFGERRQEVAPRDPAKAEALYTATNTYDLAGQLKEIKRQVDKPGQTTPSDLTWSFDYDADGNKEKVVEPGQPDAVTTFVEHDGRGLPWRTTVSGGTGDSAKSRTTITEYDANGNLRREVKPAGIGSDNLPRGIDDGTNTPTNLERAAQDATIHVYDADDLKTAERLPWHDETGKTDKRIMRGWERDTKQRWVTAITAPHEVSATSAWHTGYHRNNAGWIVSMTDQRKASVKSTDGTRTYNPVAKYEWDEQGHQTRWRSENAHENDKGRDMKWEYWPNGTLKRRSAVKTIDPAGTPETADSVRTYDYLYNANRSLVRVVDHDPKRTGTADKDEGKPRTTVFARDTAERETKVDEEWKGGKDVQLSYEPGTGRLAERRTDGTFDPTTGAYTGGDVKKTTFDYDSQGRELTMTVDPSQGTDRVTKTRWHDSGVMRQREKDNGTTDQWTWDALRQKTRHERIRKGQTTDPDAITYQYDLNGNRKVDERGDHTFNARDQLVKWVRPDTDKVRSDRRAWTTEYTLDTLGQTTQKLEKDKAGTTKIDTALEYDGERLKKTTSVDKTQAVQVTTTQTYRHDDAGNVQRIYTQASITGGAILEPPPNGETALAPDECDDDDSTASTKVTSYCYDEFNRQVFSAGSGLRNPSYVTYDGLDRRDRKVVRNTNDGPITETRDLSYVGTSELVSAESVTKSGTTKRQSYDYDSAGDRQGQQTDQGTTTKYRTYAKDANGSVVGLEKADGTIDDNERYDYDPYGELDRKQVDNATDSMSEDEKLGLSADAQDNPFRFEGFYFDSGVKTYDMHARHYRPAMGRFLSRDQYASATGDQALQADPLTQNRYAFAGANPTTNVEFDGHDRDPVQKERIPAHPNRPNNRGRKPQKVEPVFANPGRPGNDRFLGPRQGAQVDRARAQVRREVKLPRVVTKSLSLGEAKSILGAHRNRAQIVRESVAKVIAQNAAVRLSQQKPERMSYKDWFILINKPDAFTLLDLIPSRKWANGSRKLAEGLKSLRTAAKALPIGADARRALSAAWRSDRGVQTTVVIGRGPDTARHAGRGDASVLKIPGNQWSIEVNDLWVAGHIANRRPVYLASKPTYENLRDVRNARSTVFGREYHQFRAAGYKYKDGYLVPPSR